MATTTRAPLAVRPRTTLNKTSRVVSGIKRSRSPDNDVAVESVKRRALETAQDKERRLAERTQKENEFREKYTRAFPDFKFYFDVDNMEGDVVPLRARVAQLGADIDDFFSNELTHFITDQTTPDDHTTADKENYSKLPRRPPAQVKSPLKRGRPNPLVGKAVEFAIKIWSTEKLKSVLDRCLPPSANASRSAPTSIAPTRPRRNLIDLLADERTHGSTERDPTQRRHDFTYFPRDHMFVLVEDLHGKLATIVAHHYPPPKGDEEPEWPVLYCHPHARNPFVKFDDKEKRRWEKTQREEREKNDKTKKEIEKLERLKVREVGRQARGAGDLRRTVSLNNMNKRLNEEEEEEPNEEVESANASGYLASGYVAASGNSVSLTSTNGTTSTSGHLRQTPMVPNLLRQKNNEVVTSRKVHKDGKGTMGPPPIPDKAIRRTRSTTAMRTTQRLPKRQEGAKPGYCECCRVKFEDFKVHVNERKHRKFAMNNTNFIQLDSLLDLVRRRTVQEVELEDADLDLDFEE